QRGNEERGQVPDPPDRAKDERRRQRAPAAEQARQGEAAPPELLPNGPVSVTRVRGTSQRSRSHAGSRLSASGARIQVAAKLAAGNPTSTMACHGAAARVGTRRASMRLTPAQPSTRAAMIGGNGGKTRS